MNRRRSFPTVAEMVSFKATARMYAANSRRIPLLARSIKVRREAVDRRRRLNNALAMVFGWQR